MELSRSVGDNVHDFIDPEWYSFSFCKFDDAIKLVAAAGVSAEMARQDVKHAFWLIPVGSAN